MSQTDAVPCGPTPEDVARLEAVVNRFEDAWQHGERPAIEDHLGAADGLRPTLLVELVHVELESRLKVGEPARVEEYLLRFPDLAHDRATVLELVEAEQKHRRRRDPAVSAAEYVQRFPEFRDALLATATASLPPADTGATDPLPASGVPAAADAGRGPTDGGMVTRARYRVLRLHACGGLGEVLAARDDVLCREVAIKRLQRRRAHDPESRGRFLREAEITGQLEHPGVVPVYGLGHDADGSPCYAMRFIRGETFQEAAERFHHEDRPGRNPRERILAFRQLLGRLVSVCNTVAYAHSRGVLHRDLKPSNILLGSFGETLVVDWGLARPAEAPPAPAAPADQTPSGSADLTQEGAVIGTPAYMSPEQAVGRWDKVGPTSDVYSLGATLFVLLTGQPPFARGEVGEVLDKVRRSDFPRPRQLKKGLCPALEAVCLKAMALRPEDRYPTALALAADLEHWLAGEPVSAWREPLRVRARRWVARHSTLVTVAAVTGVACAGLAVVVALWQAAADRERIAADRARIAADGEQTAQKLAAVRQELLDRADQESYPYHLAAADRAWWAGRFDFARQRLKACKPELRGWDWNQLARRCREDSLLTLEGGHSKEVWNVAYSPDGKRLASASLDGTVKVWDAATGRELLHLAGHDEQPVWAVAFSPDGKLLATGSDDRSVRLWDAATGAAVRVLGDLPAPVNGVAFSPDGKRLAAAIGDVRGPAADGRNLIQMWDPGTGEEAGTHRVPGGATSVAFSPDGKRFAAGSFDSKVRVWNAADRAEPGEPVVLAGHNYPVRAVAFSPDGRLLASASLDYTVGLWDVATKAKVILRGHTGWVWGVAFSPDGTRLASSADDNTVRIWDVAFGGTVQVLHGHTRGIANVAYSPDGTRLASASDDQTVRIWDATAVPQTSFALLGHRGSVVALASGPDGRVVTAGSDQTVRVWDAAARRLLLTISTPARSQAIAFSPDGSRVASALEDSSVRVWDAATGREEQTLQGHRDRVRAVAFSPDGKRLASGSWDKTVKVWDVATGAELLTLAGHTGKVRAVAFSPDGKTLASAGEDRIVKLWDATTGQETAALGGHPSAVTCLAFSPDGKRLAVGTLVNEKVMTREPGEITLWDVAVGQVALTLRGHTYSVQALAFSPDGRRLASAGADGRLKLWEPATGQDLLTVDFRWDNPNGVAFSPDSTRLVSANGDGTVVVWDGTPPE